MSKKPLFSKPVKKQTMAEQMAEAIQEAILSGELAGGIVLPTEPELAEQFEVSRAVVRDATRLLMARGLVEVQHGRGVFVTEPDNEAFGEALLLALQRVQATAWDVEQFEQVLFPEVVALAAGSASDEEITELWELADTYIDSMTEHHQTWWGRQTPPEELARLMAAYRQFMMAIFTASHNRVIQRLAQPLLRLRNLREWADREGGTIDELLAVETGYVRRLVALIAGRDPVQARAQVRDMMSLPSEAVVAMRQTPVGEISKIPVPLPAPSFDSQA